MVSSQVAAGPSAPVGPPLSLLPRPLVHVVRQQAPTREGSVPRARGLLNDGAHHHLPRHGGLCHGLPLAYRRGREDREGHHHREEAPLHSASSTHFLCLSLSVPLCLSRVSGKRRGLARWAVLSAAPTTTTVPTSARPPRGSSRLSSRAQPPHLREVGSEEPHLVLVQIFAGPLHSVFYERHSKFFGCKPKPQETVNTLQHFYNLIFVPCPMRPARRWQVRSRRPASEVVPEANMAIGVLVLVVVGGGGGKQLCLFSSVRFRVCVVCFGCPLEHRSTPPVDGGRRARILPAQYKGPPLHEAAATAAAVSHRTLPTLRGGWVCSLWEGKGKRGTCVRPLPILPRSPSLPL